MQIIYTDLIQLKNYFLLQPLMSLSVPYNFHFHLNPAAGHLLSLQLQGQKL